MMTTWTQAGPAALAAFLASLVEFVEALTIVLAVGMARGWRPALAGSAAGIVLLAALVVLLGPVLGNIPLAPLQVTIGLLLLLFGMRWLRKAILRAAGIIPLHDEAAAFTATTADLRAAGPAAVLQLDPLAVATSFKAVVLEGIEVVFIVTAVGATGGMLLPATLGALAAGLLVVALGITLHRPLTRVPENTLKFTVGVLLSAFGIFWVGEGFGFAWPGEDLAIPALAAIILATSAGAVRLARGALSMSTGSVR
jgi:uncharacterized membrane protein